MATLSTDSKSYIPEGISGNWKIERFTVTKEDESLQRIRAMFDRGRMVPAGSYTRLMRNGETIMSDTPDEVRDLRSVINYAKGEVLINGLGLGIVLEKIFAYRNKEVSHVTVIEKSQDVISLVGKYYQDKFGDRLEIICADAFEYKPPKGKRYDIVWHDIWDAICSDNLAEMAKLHRKYGRRTDWQGSWCKEQCKMYRSRGC